MYLLRDLVSTRTWLAMTQHLAGLLIGFVAIFIITFGLGFGFGFLFFALVGLPLLGVTVWLAHWFARAERARFAFLTGARIPAWPAPGSSGRTGFRWGIIPRWRMWTESATWSEIGYALLRLPVSAVAAAISILAWAFGLILLTLPAYAWSLPSGGPMLGVHGAAHQGRADPVRRHRRAGAAGRAAADPRPGHRGHGAGPPAPRPSPRTWPPASPSWRSAGNGWSTRSRPSAGGSNATCTTAPSSGWSASPCSSGWPGSTWRRDLAGRRDHRRRARAGQGPDGRTARAHPRHPAAGPDRPRVARRARSSSPTPPRSR